MSSNDKYTSTSVPPIIMQSVTGNAKLNLDDHGINDNNCNCNSNNSKELQDRDNDNNVDDMYDDRDDDKDNMSPDMDIIPIPKKHTLAKINLVNTTSTMLSISPIPLKKTITDYRATSVSLQMWSNCIVSQIPINTKEFPELPALQSKSTEKAKDFQKNISPKILNTYSDIVDLSNQFNSYYAELTELGKHLKDDHDRTRCINGLNTLLNGIIDKIRKAESVKELSSDYNKSLIPLNKHFQTETNKVTKELTGDDKDSELYKLNERKKALLTQYHTAIAASIVGAASLVGGVILIGVGSMDGAQLAGGTIAAGGTATMIIEAVRAADIYRDISVVNDRINTLKNQLNAITTIAKVNSILTNDSINLKTASINHLNLLNSLQNNMKLLINGIKNKTVTSSQFIPMLNDAKNGYLELHKYSMDYMLNHNITIQQDTPQTCKSVSHKLLLHKLSGITLFKPNKNIKLDDNKPLIHSKSITDAAKNTSANTTTIQTYCATVTTQEILSFPKLLPNLSEYQKQGKKHANNWMNNSLPVISKCQNDVDDFCNTFLGFFDKLYELAGDINSGDNKKQFIQGIKILITNTQSKQKESKKIVSTLQTFNELLGKDVSNFNTVTTKAGSKIGGAKGEIATLNKVCDDLQKTIKACIIAIAVAATAAAVGGAMIVVGGFTEVVSGGTSTALVAAGIAGVVGGGVTIGVETALLIKAQKAYAKQNSQLQTDKQQYAALKTINSTMNEWNTQGQAALTAVLSLMDGWNNIENQFGEVIQSLQHSSNPDYGSWLQSQLNTAKGDFTDLHKLVMTILQLTKLPVKKTDNKLESKYKLTKLPKTMNVLSKMANVSNKHVQHADLLTNKLLHNVHSNNKSLVNNFMLSRIGADKQSITGDIANVHKYINAWKNTYSQQCTNALESVKSNYNYFTTRYNKMISYVNSIKSSQPKQDTEQEKQQVIKVLNFLETSANKTKVDLNALLVNIESLRKNVSNSIGVLNGDISKEHTEINETKTSIKNEQSGLNSLQHQIKKEKEIGGIIGGIFGPIGGFASSGITDLIDKLDGMQHRISSDQTVINDDMHKIDSLTVTLNTLITLNKTLQKLLTSIQVMDKLIIEIVNSYNIIISKMKSVQPDSDWLLAQLQALMNDWKDLNQINLQTQL